MPITLTTWNIQNFAEDTPVFQDKLNYLVSILQTLGSDVIALQEILDPNALDNLAARLGFHHFTAKPDSRGIRVAFLSRDEPVQPPQEIVRWQLPTDEKVRSFNDSGQIVIEPEFPRPALHITVLHNGTELDIITVHMKSKLLTFGENFSTSDETLRAQTAYFALQRRAAEAMTLREHATSLLSNGRRLVLLGDLNDVHEAATTQIFYGPPGSQPHGTEDSTQVSGAFQRSDAGDSQRLFNVTNLVPKDIRWSRKHNGQEELLDHILASEQLMPRAANGLRRVPAVSILNEDTPNLIGTNPLVGGVIPDHAPVTATFV
jgi:endonuclease/exonuclease/phosphatase family metal-dependent hydrolase